MGVEKISEKASFGFFLSSHEALYTTQSVFNSGVCPRRILDVDVFAYFCHFRYNALAIKKKPV